MLLLQLAPLLLLLLLLTQSWMVKN